MIDLKAYNERKAAAVIRRAGMGIMRDLRFLDMAVWRLEPAADSIGAIATDGSALIYDPNYIVLIYNEEPKTVLRAYLHSLLHCIFAHCYGRNIADAELWAIACDICVENTINELGLYGDRPGRIRRQRAVTEGLEVFAVTAPEVYRHLVFRDPSEEERRELAELFRMDDHRFWRLSMRKNDGDDRGIEPPPGEDAPGGDGAQTEPEENAPENAEERDSEGLPEGGDGPEQPRESPDGEPMPHAGQGGEDAHEGDGGSGREEGGGSGQESGPGEDGESEQGGDEGEKKPSDEAPRFGRGLEEQSDRLEDMGGSAGDGSREDSERHGGSDAAPDGSRQGSSHGEGGMTDSSEGAPKSAGKRTDHADGRDAPHSPDDDAPTGGAMPQGRPERQDSDAEGFWASTARRMRVQLQTEYDGIGAASGGLVVNLDAAESVERDYSRFLRRFSVLGEEMRIDMDEFDYIFYTYGLKLYSNMPLIEHLEYREEKRIRTFVIAIDTSASVHGEEVERFVRTTCGILRERESFFERVDILIIQCDCEIQSAVRIKTEEELDAYLSDIRLHGFGGTDFRPVFDYVDGLIAEKRMDVPGGLIYFTDGLGTFPTRMPAYPTAFLFCGGRPKEVPVWAIRYDFMGDEWL